MPDSPSLAFRHNPDGSWDAICQGCQMVAASAMTEDALRQLGTKHVCYEWNLRLCRKLCRDYVMQP
jgi:hypothetical protein